LVPGKQPSRPPRIGERTTAQNEAGFRVAHAFFHFFEMELHRHGRRNDRPCATKWVSDASALAARLHKGPPAKGEPTMCEQVAALTAGMGEVQREAVKHDDQELLAATQKARDDLDCAAAWL
jgi:hypothetical protein